MIIIIITITIRIYIYINIETEIYRVQSHTVVRGSAGSEYLGEVSVWRSMVKQPNWSFRNDDAMLALVVSWSAQPGLSISWSWCRFSLWLAWGQICLCSKVKWGSTVTKGHKSIQYTSYPAFGAAFRRQGGRGSFTTPSKGSSCTRLVATDFQGDM